MQLSDCLPVVPCEGLILFGSAALLLGNSTLTFSSQFKSYLLNVWIRCCERSDTFTIFCCPCPNLFEMCCFIKKNKNKRIERRDQLEVFRLFCCSIWVVKINNPDTLTVMARLKEVILLVYVIIFSSLCRRGFVYFILSSGIVKFYLNVTRRSVVPAALAFTWANTNVTVYQLGFFFLHII